ncbi:XPG domain containing-domain-containing protein [Cryomyces antarcticus]
MGIPHLITHLRPYASPVTFTVAQPDEDQASREAVIIDGPALAYHVYHKCLAQRTRASNALEAAPSYAELGDAALLWLEALQLHGQLRIIAIYFDGFLPDSKKSTRLTRLQFYLNQLSIFRSANNNGLPTSHVPAKLTALPASPFLVPAVVEALLNSKFREVTSVVPGEADAHCADLARKKGGTILTSDSDLLVHDIGPSGSVVLFRDLDIVHVASKGDLLKGLKYHPAGIAKELNLESLVGLAFYMKQDHTRGFRDCVRLAKVEPIHTEDRRAFATEYTSLPYCKLTALVQQHPGHSLGNVLRFLDPRVSEYIHRREVDLLTNGAGRSGTHGLQSDVVLYLPFLIDDPTRGSAWRSGASIRALGYSILSLTNPTASLPGEVERRGLRIASTTRSLLNIEEVSCLCKSLTDTLTNRHFTYSGLSEPEVWHAFGAQLVCSSLLEEEKPLPSTSDLRWLLSQQHVGSTWARIHLSAQLQAALYSLRMLKQFIEVFLAVSTEPYNDHQDKELLATISSLRSTHEQLRSLPALGQLLPNRNATLAAGEKGLTSTVSCILDELGMRKEPSFDEAAQRKKKRKRISGANTAAKAQDLPKHSTNMYSLLSSDS